MDISALTQNTHLEAWLPFGDDAEVLVRHIPRDGLQVIRRAATVTAYRNKAAVETYDRDKADELLAAAAVRDWRGFENGGEPWPCTPENAALLMCKWTQFAAFVNEACIDLERLAAARKAELAKN